MTVTTRTLAGALVAAAGRDQVRDDAGALAAAAVDDCRPRWVVTPRSVDAVAAVLALARDADLVVQPRGAGTTLELGLPPARVDLVLDLRGLDAVLEHTPEDLTVTAQAGITAGALAARLEPHRQLLPLDPPGAAARTLGGILATAASGPLRARYGTGRDLLLGVRFVQADGVVTWGGARVVKSVTGYDIPKLLVGSLGTLAVLAEVTLRLHPMPETEATVLVTVAGAEAAQELVARVLDSTLQPNRLEYLGERALAACGLPAMPAALAVSFATVAPAVRAQQAALADLVARARGTLQTMGPAFWETYDRVLSGAGPVMLRVSTLVDRFARTVAEIAPALPGEGLLVTASPSLGTLRMALPGRDVAAVAKGVDRLRVMTADSDGSVVVERGPVALRRAVDPWGAVDPGTLALMRRLKDEFDPTGVLNPGRFVGGI